MKSISMERGEKSSTRKKMENCKKKRKLKAQQTKDPQNIKIINVPMTSFQFPFLQKSLAFFFLLNQSRPIEEYFSFSNPLISISLSSKSLALLFFVFVFFQPCGSKNWSHYTFAHSSSDLEGKKDFEEKSDESQDHNLLSIMDELKEKVCTIQIPSEAKIPITLILEEKRTKFQQSKQIGHDMR